MKKNTNSQIHIWIVALCSFICFYNGSVVNNTSSEGITTPDVNFYGTLEDHAHTSNVEFILIGGKYESIPVYNTQTNLVNLQNDSIQQIDPKQNKTLINLQDIKSIALQHPNSPKESSIAINNKIYIQIVIEFLHGAKKNYLIESSRKITCKEIDKSIHPKENQTLHDRDLHFIHVKKLSINGYKSNYPYKAPEISAVNKISEKENIQKSIITNSEKENFKNNTAELLQTIEENVKNLPLDNPTAFETMRSTILILLKSLRDQLQKFLDMIK